MKICLYFEAENLPLCKVSGIGTAFKNQKKALEANNIQFTLDPKEDYDVLVINWFGFKTISTINKAKKQGKKVAIYGHTTVEDTLGAFTLYGLVTPLVRKLMRWFFSKADVLLAPSHHTLNLLRAYGLTNRIEVISNGIDLNQFKDMKKKRIKYRKKYGVKKNAVVGVGGVVPRKGVIDFIEVAKSFPQDTFLWFGHFYNKAVTFFPKMYKAIEDKTDNVIFTGYVKEITAAYAMGDIFLFPSYNENQGIVILEAAAMGMPILVRDLPTYKGWLVPGKNCFKAKDNKELVRYLKKIMGSKKLRDKMSKEAIKLAKENDLKLIGKKLYNILRSL